MISHRGLFAVTLIYWALKLGAILNQELYHSKDWLLEEYVTKRRGISNMATECKTSKSVICYHMDKYDIPRRPIGETMRGRRYVTPEHRKEMERKFRERYKDTQRENYKRWRQNNPEASKARYRRHMRKKLATVAGRLNNAMRVGMHQVLKSRKNGRSWLALVNYTVADLTEHIESQFEPWMNWDNWGVYKPGTRTWQIDHIIPISFFNITSAECDDFIECWSLKNLRPLLAEENNRKANRYTPLLPACVNIG